MLIRHLSSFASTIDFEVRSVDFASLAIISASDDTMYLYIIAEIWEHGDIATKKPNRSSR